MSKTPNGKTMTLRCQYGEGHDWTRGSQRGRPPKFCPEHTVAGADNKTGLQKRERPVKRTEVEKRDAKVTGGNVAVVETSDFTEETPQEMQERMEREAAIRVRTEKALATKAAKKAQREAEEAQRKAEAIDKLRAHLPTLFERYDAAWETANKENTKAAWNKADAAQMACINAGKAIREGAVS